MLTGDQGAQDLPSLIVCTSNYCSRRVRRNGSLIVVMQPTKQKTELMLKPPDNYRDRTDKLDGFAAPDTIGMC